MTSLTGKTIWIVGASSGIGEALTLQLASAGNFVIASARSETKLQRLALSQSLRIKALRFDVTSASLEDVRTKLYELTDFVDLIIYCAGTCEYEDNLTFDAAAYQRVMDVNFFGLVRVLQLAKPLLRNADGQPQLAVISSLSTYLPLPRNEMYGASKAALDYFVNALRLDLSNINIQISLIKPGFVATELTEKNDFPMPFIVSAAEAANKIIIAITQRRDFYAFPWRLHTLLRITRWVECVWLKWVGPKITRIKKW